MEIERFFKFDVKQFQTSPVLFERQEKQKIISSKTSFKSGQRRLRTETYTPPRNIFELNYTPDLKAQREKEKKLHQLFEAGDFKGVKKLIDEGIDLNCLDEFGKTILYKCFEKSRGSALQKKELISNLLEMGADINFAYAGETILHAFFDNFEYWKEDFSDVLRILLQFNPDLNKKFLGKTALERCFEKVKGYQEYDYLRRIPLMDVFFECEKADPNEYLDYAIQRACKGLGDWFLQVLMKYDLDLQSNHNLLSYLIENGKFDVSVKLIGQGASVNARHLYLALKQKNKEFILFLISKGVNVNGDRFACPVAMAIKDNEVEVLMALKALNADLSMDINKNSKLFLLDSLLIKGIKADTLKILLEQGEIDPNYRDKEGRTPLWTAWTCNNPQAFKVLVEYGADVNARAPFNLRGSGQPMKKFIINWDNSFYQKLRREGLDLIRI